MPDQAVGRLDHRLCGPVILFQPVFSGFREILAEIQNVFNAGPPEGIYALCIVSHYGNIAVHECQVLYDQVLGQVGILVFINEYVPEFFPVTGKDLRILLKEYIGKQQQVVKVHSP